LNALTEVDNGNSGDMRCNCEHFNDGLDKVKYQLPVVASRRVVVTNTSRVVNHERDVSNALCNAIKTFSIYLFVYWCQHAIFISATSFSENFLLTEALHVALSFLCRMFLIEDYTPESIRVSNL